MVKSVSTGFIGMAICITMAIPKRCFREKPELDYFSEDLRWNWTERSKLISKSVIDIGGGDHVVPLDLFSIAGIGSYKAEIHIS